MFISHKYKVIFVHIQRTGGNSINKVFQMHDPDLIEIVPIDPHKQRTRHCYISDIQTAIEADIFNRYTKFCTVRNPFDRLVSWYFMFKNGLGEDEVPTTYEHVGGQVMQLVKEHAPDFEAFVRLPKNHESGLFRRFHTSQLDYISDKKGIAVDRILRFENLTEAFQQFATTIGLEGELPHVNRSSRIEEYRNCYSDQAKEIIRERFKPDFDYFEY